MERLESDLSRDRFGALWCRLGAPGGADRVFDQLLAAYRESHRHYHGAEHLRDCLAQLDTAPADGSDRDLVEAALWFHDVEYDPRAADNESRSAALAERELVEAGVPEWRAREVGRLVRITDHVRPPVDPAATLVCDVDLSILGRSAAEFAEYERRIRAEYDWVPEPQYRKHRAALLTRLVARTPLYGTEHFGQRYEAAARRNLRRSLDALGGGAG